jgi:putative lipoic acid-binding regulatory protein
MIMQLDKEQMSDPDQSPLQFPCSFPIKAMGLASDTFDAMVVGIVRRHAPDIGEAAVTVRPSNGGKYLAVTVTIQAHSRAQLDAIYHDLVACEQVLVAL